MDDNKLRDLLRDLPRESVSADFRARLLSRLDGADRRNRARRRLAPVLAFAVAVAVTAGGAVFFTLQRREARIEQARLESLEFEYRAIEQDFQELRHTVAAAQPMVGIEGPGERGYLVDLPELAKARAEGSVPVAYRLSH